MLLIKTYIAKRLLQLIPVLIGITLLSFLLMHAASGDYVDLMYDNMGTAVTDATKDALREELGLDHPLPLQYLHWLKNIFQGDMGTSYVSGQPVFHTFMKKLPATLSLAFFSVLLTIFISVPFGILSAVKQNRFWDYLIRAFSFAGNSIPGFFLSLLLIYFFSIRLNLLPVIQTSSWTSFILPSLSLSCTMSAKYVRQVRAAVLEELGKDYVAGARMRGISESIILYKNVLKTAAVTLLTFLGISIGSLLGGTAVIETIFMWDGIGKMAVEAVLARDYPVIQAYVMWTAIIYVMISLLIDILYRLLDPRIRLHQEGGLR